MKVLERTTEGSPVTRMITLPFPRFIHAAGVPWQPWVMPGVDCKLLSVNRRTGGFTCLLKVAPGEKAPVHHHLGALEIYVLEGDMSYEPSDVGRAGAYLYEPAGDIHQPLCEAGSLLFCVFHGPIAGLDDDGGIAGIVDHVAIMRWAEESGVAEHVVIA